MTDSMAIIIVYKYSNKVYQLEAQITSLTHCGRSQIFFYFILKLIEIFLIYKMYRFFKFSLEMVLISFWSLNNNGLNKNFNTCSFYICMSTLILISLKLFIN